MTNEIIADNVFELYVIIHKTANNINV